jgi:hypothetical protein
MCQRAAAAKETSRVFSQVFTQPFSNRKFSFHAPRTCAVPTDESSEARWTYRTDHVAVKLPERIVQPEPAARAEPNQDRITSCAMSFLPRPHAKAIELFTKGCHKNTRGETPIAVVTTQQERSDGGTCKRFLRWQAPRGSTRSGVHPLRQNCGSPFASEQWFTLRVRSVVHSPYQICGFLGVNLTTETAWGDRYATSGCGMHHRVD